MAAHNPTITGPGDVNASWRTLVELALAEEALHRDAAERVITALQSLEGWPLPNLEPVILMFCEAIRRTVRFRRAPCGLMIRVLIARGGAPPSDWPAAHGWGFFMVRRHEERSSGISESAYEVVELFLYHEGARSP